MEKRIKHEFDDLCLWITVLFSIFGQLWFKMIRKIAQCTSTSTASSQVQLDQIQCHHGWKLLSNKNGGKVLMIISCFWCSAFRPSDGIRHSIDDGNDYDNEYEYDNENHYQSTWRWNEKLNWRRYHHFMIVCLCVCECFCCFGVCMCVSTVLVMHKNITVILLAIVASLVGVFE